VLVNNIPTVRIVDAQGNDLNLNFTNSAPTFNTGQVTLGATKVLILSPNSHRTRLIVSNNSGNDVFLGNSSVTLTTGYLLHSPGDIEIMNTSAIYGISKKSSLITFWEETF